MRNIDFLVEQDNINSKIWIIHILNNPVNLNKMALNFRFLEVSHAIKCIADENFQQSKQHFYTASLLDQLRIEQFNGDVLSYDVKSVCNPILSDNEELVKRFSKLRYHAWGKMPGMDENVLKGKNDVWANTVQFFMVNDVEKIERNLNIIETITIKKLPKNQQELLIDFDFFKALYLGDKSKMEEALDNLVSPKIHKKRNINDIHAQYVSFPALGYAKLAWLKGIEVEVKSHLVPKELLPIQPLEKYEIPYDFLKES